MTEGGAPGRRSIAQWSGERLAALVVLNTSVSDWYSEGMCWTWARGPSTKVEQRDKEGGRHDSEHLGDQGMIRAACQSTTGLYVHNQGCPRNTEGTD